MMTVTDERGLAYTTSNATAVEHYDTTVRDYLEYRTATMEQLRQTLAADPEFVMGHCLKAYFALLAGTVGTLEEARQALAFAQARAAAVTARERCHLAACQAWLAGDMRQAVWHWDEILMAHPTDILALRLQHFATFWMGHSLALRDRVARVLPAWDECTPGYSYVLGMYAFGLEESGDYASAEAHGKRAVERNPDDLWAIHAVAHVLDMQGRLQEGSAWLDYPLDAWQDRNAMRHHLWWHLALFPFEQGDYDRVLELYDALMAKQKPEFYIEIQNAAALLWRLEFQGIDVRERWRQLAEVCETRLDDHVLAFTDLHVMMALTASGRRAAAERFVASLRRFAQTPTNYMAATMHTVTLPLCESMLAYYQGDYAAAVNRVLPLRYEIPQVGGSHAQRDVFAQFLITAACKGQQWYLARALLAERLAWRPHSHSTWLTYAEVLEQCGDPTQAETARQRAAALRGV